MRPKNQFIYSPIFTIRIAFVPPTLPICSPQVATIKSPFLTAPLSKQDIFCFFQHQITIWVVRQFKGLHIAVQSGFTHRCNTWRQRKQRHVNTLAAHPQCGRTGFRQGRNRLHAQMMRCEQSAVRNRLIDTREL